MGLSPNVPALIAPLDALSFAQRKNMGLTLSPGNIKANLVHFTQLIEERMDAWTASNGSTPAAGDTISICLDDAV